MESALNAATQEQSETPQPAMHQVEEVLHTLAAAPQLPGFLRTRNVREQFQYAFELIGGIPRLAHWAHDNPDKFYQLYSKLIPAQVTGAGGGPLQIQLSWVNERDTTGRSNAAIIDAQVLPDPERPNGPE